jgi:hypothetical protein
VTAPEATVEALVYHIRTRGLEAIADNQRRYRITLLDDKQIEEVCRRLTLNPRVLRAYQPESSIF